jgi:hypothetical protein
MSIEKTALNGSIETLCKWLKSNALGVYFDEITLDSSDGKNKVICKTGGIDFLAFYEDVTKSNGGILVKNKVGESTKIESSIAMTYGYGYKLGGGLMISFRSSGGSFTEPRIAVAKDNSGNTTIVAERTIMTESGSVYNMGVYNPDSQPLGRLSIPKTANITALTSMCPFVVCGQEASYTPDVFYTPFTQYTGEAVYDINGTKYLSNGIFAMKIQEGK